MPILDRFTTLAALSMAVTTTLTGWAAAAEPVLEHPNVILIVADDMGWGDVGYHESEIETPALDDLAGRGAELDRFYVNPTCSPTRASLLTGQIALRLGVLRPLSKNNPTGLPLDRRLLPEYLQEAGYQTAMAGKWHLGYLKRAHNPNQRGFDSYYGHVTGGVGYWDHVHGGGYDWQRDGVTVREEGYTTQLITAEAERVIAERDVARPLFLYVAYNAPHLPSEAPASALAQYAQIENPYRRAHAAMVSEMDRGIGRIVAALEHAGMTENTIIWFLSDNGGLNPDVAPAPLKKALGLARFFFDDPLPTRGLRFAQMNVEEGAGDNGPFRMGKQSVYEGGVRVPSVVVWPGRIPPGKIDGRVTVVDVLPTLLAGAHVEPEIDTDGDGRSRLGLISGRPTRDRAPDFITVSLDGEAIYRDQWKLIELASGARELYDLQGDPTERQDVSDIHPDVVADLAGGLAAFPRGEDVSLPFVYMLFDPDEFGGEEVGPPMAERIRD